MAAAGLVAVGSVCQVCFGLSLGCLKGFIVGVEILCVVAELGVGGGLIALVRELAEEYSEFNAYINYLYKVYGGREDERGIRIRSCLITMRSFFVLCVESLARVVSASRGAPYPSLLAEVKMYASSVRPHVEAITREYRSLCDLVECEGGSEVVRQLGEIVANINRIFEEIGRAG